MQPLRCIATLDLVGHVDVCQLGVAVGSSGVVLRGRGGSRSVEIETGNEAVADRADDYDAGVEVRGGAGEERGFEEMEEKEVA